MSDVAPTGGSRPQGLVGARVAGVVVLILLLLGFVSVLWTPYPTDSVDVGTGLLDPGAAHWLGTDQFGRDLFSLLMKGVLASFVIGAVAVAIGFAIGAPLGLAAVSWGRPADWLASLLGGYLSTLPALFVAVLLVTAFGPGAVTLMTAIGIANVPVFAATLRDGLMAQRGLDYVAAARLAGMSDRDIARRHTRPAMLRRIGGQVLTQLAVSILLETSLSYLGLGPQPPATSLGVLIHDAQSIAAMKPLPVLIPGLLLVVLVVSLNIAARGVRGRENDLAAA